MRHPFGETIGIKPFVTGSKDAHNNPAKSWGDPVNYPGCAVAPSSSAETTDNRDANTVVLTVYGPPEMTATARDIAVYQGLEYDIDGAPERWRSPFNGSEPGCVLTIRRTDG